MTTINRRIQFFISAFLIIFFCGCRDKPPEKILNRQLRQIGAEGTSPGLFHEPRGLTFTSVDDLIVTDFRNYRIQLLHKNGTPIKSWGKQGDLAGELNDPTCAATDSTGNLYVVDTWNHRVQKWSTDGSCNANWSSKGDFYAPRGIAIDDQDRIYVSNTSMHNILVFSKSGDLIATWGQDGAGIDQLHDPLGLAFGPDGNLYIADTGNQRIKVMNNTGQTLSVIPVPEWKEDRFNEAYLAVGNDGKIYTTAPHSNLIIVYDKNGEIFSRFGESGSGPEQLSHPTGITVDRSGNIYISDSLNNRVVKYAQAPQLIQKKQEKNTILASLVSIIRVLIDLAALCIIIFWLIKRGKPIKSKPPKPDKERKLYRKWVSFLQKLETKQTLMLFLFIAAVILVLISTIAIHFDSLRTGYLLLLIGLVVLIFHELPKSFRSISFQDQKKLSGKWILITVIILLFISTFVRIYKLDTIPCGINNDAAWNGMYALRILDGEPYIPFTNEAWGKSTLYFYLIAQSFKLFGISKYTMLIPCIIVGILTVLILYFLLKYLFGCMFAAIASFIYATMAWNIVFSRTGYRAILSPLCLLLTFLFFFLAVDSGRWWKKLLLYLLSGSFIGLGLHTYFAFRGIPLMMVFIWIYSWVTKKNFMRRNWWGLIIFLLAASATFSPLVIYALESPENFEAFMGRSDFLFIGKKISQAGSLKPLWLNLKHNFSIFHYKARVGNFFNNDWPILTAILAFFGCIGFGTLSRHIKHRSSFFVFLIFIFGMLPGILSEPDAARSIMTTVAIAVFASAGITGVARPLYKSNTKKAAVILCGVLALSIGFAEYNFYFNRLGKDYYAQFGYAKKHTLIGYKGLELSKDNTLYISQGHFIDTPKFICYNVPGDVFAITDGEVIDVVPPAKLVANIEEILNSSYPENKGLAFVLENDFRNKPIFKRILEKFPDGKYIEYREDTNKDNVIFYTYVIANDQLKSSEVTD